MKVVFFRLDFMLKRGSLGCRSGRLLYVIHFLVQLMKFYAVCRHFGPNFTISWINADGKWRWFLEFIVIQEHNDG